VVNEILLDNQKENKKNQMVIMINNQIKILMNENIFLLLNEILSKIIEELKIFQKKKIFYDTYNPKTIF
jgi:hypothetical protein